MLGKNISLQTKVTTKDRRNSRHLLFLLSTLSIGGSERKTVRIANALGKRDWKLTIAYLDPPHTLRDEISDNIDILFLDRKGRFGLGALRQLTRYVADKKINLICCINLNPLLYGFLTKKLFPSNSLTVFATTNETHFIWLKDKLKMILYAPMLRRIDTIIFGSSYQKNFWTHQYKLDPAECTYIHNGVDTNLFCRSLVEAHPKNIRSILGIPENALVVGSIGRFRKEKQYQIILRACVELRLKKGLNVHCLLVGGGYEEQHLRDLIAQIGCKEYIHLLDTTDDVRPNLKAMDLFVLSSISETFSNAALEAMSMSLPVVLPRVGGCPEMVEFGVNGFIYEPGDTSQLVEYLFLLGVDKNFRLKIGQAARNYVESHFHFESMVKSYVDLFENAL